MRCDPLRAVAGPAAFVRLPLYGVPEAVRFSFRYFFHRAAVCAAPYARGPKFWSRPTDTGNTLDCAFCGECGSRLWHQRRGSTDTLSVKGGSLDKPVDLSQAIHIWTSRMIPGIVLPQGAAQFPGEPDES